MIAWENHVIERCLWASGAHSTWPFLFCSALCRCSLPLHRSFVFFSPPTTPTELTKSSLSDDCSTASQPQKLLPYTVVTYISHIGTVWSRWEPAARRSSPAHPPSWQAPIPFPGRARKRQALCNMLFHRVVLPRSNASRSELSTRFQLAPSSSHRGDLRVRGLRPVSPANENDLFYNILTVIVTADQTQKFKQINGDYKILSAFVGLCPYYVVNLTTPHI